MVQKFRAWIFGSLQVKVLLLIVSVMLLLVAVFVYYNVQIQRDTLEDVLRQKGTSMALTGAAAVGHLLEDAVASGRFSEAEIFDTDYQPIPNTNPQKYNTVYDSFTDTHLPRLQEAYLKDPDVLFAAAVDRNGYLPTHNARYANPLTGDYQTDLENNRTKRIFDDTTGLAAAENTDPSLFQVYFRDTGEIAWDISAPIWVNDKHWGAFRVAFSLDEIAAQTAALTRRITLAAGLLVTAIGLASFLIARQIARPIGALVGATQKLGEGNLDVEIEVKSQDEVGQLGLAFNRMAARLKELVDTLEQQVADRTQRLRMVATISEQLNAILDFDRLLLELVNQVKENFDYYHAHVYVIDDKGENLVMTAGSGEAGETLKARGHIIPFDAPTSLVARAARNNEIVSVSNVREAPDWLPNELLPDTYAEMAVPIVLDGAVVGVLDVQEDEIGGLDESDASILRSLANHVAVAIRNAHLFAEVEQTLAEARAVHERYMNRAWHKSNIELDVDEYVYVQPDAPSLAETVVSNVEQKSQNQLRSTIIAVNDSEDNASALKAIVAPVNLSGKPIGTLQLYQIGDKKQDQDWTEEDLEFIEAILDQVAQTAESLRLFDETRQRASRDRTIRTVTDKLRAAPSLDRLLEIATMEISHLFSVAHAELELGADSRQAGNGNGNGASGAYSVDAVPTIHPEGDKQDG